MLTLPTSACRWPSASTDVTCCFDRSQAEPGPTSLFRRVLLAEKQAGTAIFTALVAGTFPGLLFLMERLFFGPFYQRACDASRIVPERCSESTWLNQAQPECIGNDPANFGDR